MSCAYTQRKETPGGPRPRGRPSGPTYLGDPLGQGSLRGRYRPSREDRRFGRQTRMSFCGVSGHKCRGSERETGPGSGEDLCESPSPRHTGVLLQGPVIGTDLSLPHLGVLRGPLYRLDGGFVGTDLETTCVRSRRTYPPLLAPPGFRQTQRPESETPPPCRLPGGSYKRWFKAVRTSTDVQDGLRVPPGPRA